MQSHHTIRRPLRLSASPRFKSLPPSSSFIVHRSSLAPLAPRPLLPVHHSSFIIHHSSFASAFSRVLCLLISAPFSFVSRLFVFVLSFFRPFVITFFRAASRPLTPDSRLLTPDSCPRPLRVSASPRFHLTPDSRLLTPARSAFTLVELLMVIVILSIVTIATIPIVRPALDTRRTREAARMLAAHITEAQTHAVETGRPAGIWIERLRTGGSGSTSVEKSAAMNVYLCEVPPPYSGDNTNSTITVRAVSGSPDYATVQFASTDLAWYGQIKPYDLIRFNYSGATYRFTGMVEDFPTSPGTFVPGTEEDPPGSGIKVLKKDYTQRFQIVPTSTSDPTFRFPPAAFPPTSNWQPPYQVNRQPIKLSTTPLQLPNGAVIDLFHSGVGTDCFANLKNPTTNLKFTLDSGPLGFTFSPSGALDTLYCVGASEKLTNPVYLLVGKREKIATDTSSAATYPPTLEPLYQHTDPRESQSENHNFRDLENLWVSINPKTGLVTTAEMSELTQPDNTTNPPTTDQKAFDDLQNVLGRTPTAHEARINATRISRQFATSAQSMGGR